MITLLLLLMGAQVINSPFFAIGKKTCKIFITSLEKPGNTKHHVWFISQADLCQNMSKLCTFTYNHITNSDYNTKPVRGGLCNFI